MDLLFAFSAVRGQKFRSAAGTPLHYSMQILLPMPMQRNAVPALQMAGLMTVAAGERLLLSSRLFGLPTPSVLAMLSFGFPHLPFFDKKKRKEFSHRRPPTAPSCDHIGPAASSCSFLPNPGGRWPRCHLSDYQLYFHSPRECLLPPPLPLLPRQE